MSFLYSSKTKFKKTLIDNEVHYKKYSVSLSHFAFMTKIEKFPMLN